MASLMTGAALPHLAPLARSEASQAGGAGRRRRNNPLQRQQLQRHNPSSLILRKRSHRLNGTNPTLQTDVTSTAGLPLQHLKGTADVAVSLDQAENRRSLLSSTKEEIGTNL